MLPVLIQFKIQKHTTRPGVEVVEIFREGKFIACIFPGETDLDTIHVVSKHSISTGSVPPTASGLNVLLVSVSPLPETGRI